MTFHRGKFMKCDFKRRAIRSAKQLCSSSNSKSKILLLIQIYLSSAVFMACQASSDNSLLSDFESTSGCPVTGCVDTSISSNGLMMSINSSTRSTDGQSKAEVTGRCSQAAFPDNRIIVSIAGPGGSTVNTPVYGINPASNETKCIDGKFHLAFDTSAFTTGQKYRVSMTLQGVRSGSPVGETSSYSQVSFDLNKN